MARRTPGRRTKPTRSRRASSAGRRSAKRPSSRGARKAAAKTGAKTTRAKAGARKSAVKKSARRAPVARKRKRSAAAAGPQKTPRLDRERRRLEEVVPSPPSSLNMQRRGSAARTGRAELAEEQRDHLGMPRAITGGDVDVDIEDAYFTGDEAPGGDNPTPDQDVVEDIGRALGVEYQDAEELKSGEKLVDRDKHRWELDPASAEDYPERKK